MKYKWIIGAGIYLEIAFNAWKQAYPEIIIEKIEVPQAQDYSFELGSLDNLDPREGTAFVAFDERSEEHTSELQSPCNLVCRLLLEKKKNIIHHLTDITLTRSSSVRSIPSQLVYRSLHSVPKVS